MDRGGLSFYWSSKRGDGLEIILQPHGKEIVLQPHHRLGSPTTKEEIGAGDSTSRSSPLFGIYS